MMDYPPTLPVFECMGKQTEYTELEKHFKKKYGHSPSFYARVPGRVNLIGEHIDYCGYAVFPMAIEQDIVLAVSENNNKTLNLCNINSETFEDFSTAIDVLKIDQSAPKWYHYFICGFRGVTEEYPADHKGLDVAVKGTIPPSAGLSSSSALVCAAALATAHANRISLSKLTIASLCAKSERYIGTQGGGMDQAIGFLAESGSAKLIEFGPLKATNVPLPSGATFVIANSCVEMNKAASSHYNVRVVECKLAAQILGKAYHLEWKAIKRLDNVQKQLKYSLHEMPSLVKEVLHQEPYTKAEICQLLGIEENEFESMYLSKYTNHLKEFKLYQRSLHVYKEADRVLQFKAVCDQQPNDALQKLGKLMNESHVSCRDLYECSHPDLDELVDTAVKAGALGSRLTGAGWGGCCVSLILTTDVKKFIEQLKEKYYLNSQGRKKMINTAVFPTQPGGGAVLYTV